MCREKLIAEIWEEIEKYQAEKLPTRTIEDFIDILVGNIHQVLFNLKKFYVRKWSFPVVRALYAHLIAGTGSVTTQR